jgi:hypothetical protein
VSPQVAGQESGTGVNLACPVCRWPDGGTEVCGVCGWRLVGDYVLGPVTPAAERELAARLAAARRRFDVRAVVRVAGRDSGLAERLARRVRDGGSLPLLLEEIGRVAAEVDAAEPPVAPASAGIGFALTRLVAGLTEAIAFIEIGPDAIAIQTLVSDGMGVPVRADGDSLPWTELLPLLPADADLRHLRMAGDLGELATESGPPAALLALVQEAISPALGRLMTVAAATVVASQTAGNADEHDSMPRGVPHRVDTVLVRRTCRWPVLDAAIVQARAFLSPVTEIVAATRAGGLGAIVEAASAQAPLRYGYELVLADVDAHSSAVRVAPLQLFAAGAAALPGAEHTVAARVAPVSGHAADRVVLPIVARRTRAVDYRNLRAAGAQRPLVDMAVLDGNAAGPADLRVTLVRPGHLDVQGAVRWPGPAGALADWPGLLAGVPDRLPGPQFAGPGLDLVLLVELGGAGQVVEARVQLARAVIDEFRGAAASVRIAVLGYRDHFGRHHLDAIPDADLEHEALIVGCKLSPVASARSMFQRRSRWAAVPIRDNHGAPVEDALQMLAGHMWNWDRGARHVLLIIGARPPHPPKATPDGDPVLACPHRWSWRDTLDRLRAWYSVECFAVLDRPVTPGYAEGAWYHLAVQDLYDATSVTARRLARDIGRPSQATAVELCLATRA